MNQLRKTSYLLMSLVLATFAAPLFAVGNVDATMSEYIKYEPNTPPVAQAVVSNRTAVAVPYVLEVMDLNGLTLGVITSGTLAPGESKVISGTASGVNKGSVRVKVGGPSGPVAIDTAWLITQSNR